MGWRWRVWARYWPRGWWCPMHPWPPAWARLPYYPHYPYPLDPREEMNILEEAKRELEAELEDVKKRLDEIKRKMEGK